MSTSQGTSDLSGRIGLLVAIGLLTSTEGSLYNEIRRLTDTLRTQNNESAEKIDDLLKELAKLFLGVDRVDTTDKLRPNRIAALEQIKDKLQVLSNRIYNARFFASSGWVSKDMKNESDIMGAIRDIVTNCQSIVLAASIPGEIPPPAPLACFGREYLIERIVGLTENLVSTALIGAGGIGKTAIALTVLHHNRIKHRFGSNRRFIRCDQFPSTRAHFLARLSSVIGAEVDNPEDLAPLRPLLSSKEMFIVLDNAESLFNPQGTDSQEISAMMHELSWFRTICFCITSRTTTVPWECGRPKIPALSMLEACEVFKFYGIHGAEWPSVLYDLLRHLDFHALSITLLASTASDNEWDSDRLAKEWDAHRAQVLRKGTDHNEGLAATIEFSLASPTFRKLGSNARDLLGVVAFFPQGLDEQHLETFFPTVSDRKTIFNKFCFLDLTYRSNGFIAMLAPIREYFYPQDPKSSQLLRAAKDYYFTRLSVDISYYKLKIREEQWVRLEDMNIGHLLGVFTSVDANTPDVWDACINLMRRYWSEPQQTVLRAKIEGLPNDHPSKLGCLFSLSQLFGSAGNHAEQKRLLTQTLTLSRELGDDLLEVQTLNALCRVNQTLGLLQEGMQQVEEALETFERFRDTAGQTENPPSERSRDFHLCQSHHLLGDIYHSKGEKEKAVDHLKAALGIASPPGWSRELTSIHYVLAKLFCDKNMLSDANVHINQAESHADYDSYDLGRAIELHAWILFRRRLLGHAKHEASRALEVYEKLGAAQDVKDCKNILLQVEQEIESWEDSDSDESDLSGAAYLIFPKDSPYRTV